MRFARKAYIPDNRTIAKDKEWEPFIFGMCFSHLDELNSLGADCTRYELCQVIKNMTGRTVPKIESCLDYYLGKNYLYETDDKRIFYDYETIKRESYLVIQPSVMEWFLDNYPMDTFAFKVYLRLYRAYYYAHNKGSIAEITIAGRNQLSLLNQIGYCSTAGKNRDKANEVIEHLESAGIVHISDYKTKYSSMGQYCGKFRTIWEVKSEIDYGKSRNPEQPSNQLDGTITR